MSPNVLAISLSLSLAAVVVVSASGMAVSLCWHAQEASAVYFSLCVARLKGKAKLTMSVG